MKANFLFKLLLVAITCVSLYSCTVDETTVSPPTHADDLTAPLDGEPIVISPPRK